MLFVHATTAPSLEYILICTCVYMYAYTRVDRIDGWIDGWIGRSIDNVQSLVDNRSTDKSIDR